MAQPLFSIKTKYHNSLKRNFHIVGGTYTCSMSGSEGPVQENVELSFLLFQICFINNGCVCEGIWII